MVLKYFDFLLEYNNKRIIISVYELANKYPDFISTKYDQLQNDSSYKIFTDNLFFKKEKRRFLNNKGLILDCNNVGISLNYIFNNIEDYDNWLLYDGEKLLICSGGGKDYINAKVLGYGNNKIAYQSRNYVLKKLEDVSTLEIFISNKYPDLFATYMLAGDNLVKQEKLKPVELLIDEDMSDEDIIELQLEFEEKKEVKLLKSKIKKILITENLKRLEPDLVIGNLGYDVNNNLKCFDFIYNKPIPQNLDSNKIHVSELNKYKIKNLNHEYYNVKHNNDINGINIIDNTKGDIYIRYTYKMLLPYLENDLIIFAMFKEY
jgi:hypothetical protein